MVLNDALKYETQTNKITASRFERGNVKKTHCPGSCDSV
jgi:hypothetical protein